MAIRRPDLYEHNNPDLAIVDSDFTRGGNRTVADLTALYALSSKSDQLKQYVTRVFVQSNSKWYTLIDINNIGSSLGWSVDQTTNLQGVTDAGATTTNAITTAGLTITGGNGLVTTSQFYASASNITNSIFVGYDSFAVYLGYQMGSVPVHIGTGGSGAIVFRNSGGFQVESLAGTGTRMMVVGSDGTVSTQSIPTGSVTSVFGRTGAVTAQSGDYTTAQVTESGNLYYTDARARAALSFSAGSGGYNSTTGVISIPTSSSNISEGSNLYFTEQRVRDSVLTGLNITGGSIISTDSVLSAFGKIQNQINGLLGGSIFQSTWNASTNSPTLTSSVGTKGHYYIVATAGSTNLNGITDWQVGDWAIFDGSVWRKVDNTDAVVSVNGFTGAVSLTTSNIPEGTGLYYTDARARLSLSAGAGISYNNSTGLISSTITQYTDSLARAALSFAAGSGAYNSSTGVITIPTNTNQLTNGAGFITGINSSMVTTALGYTPPQPNGTGASGTWGINITGNAATATNATQWGSYTNNIGGGPYDGAPDHIAGFSGTVLQRYTQTSVRSFLGLGSYAYRSSGLAELSGATFTGAISGTTASFSGASNFATSSGNFVVGSASSGDGKVSIVVPNSGTNVSALDISNLANASFNVSLRTNITEITAGGAGNIAISNSAERIRITSGGNVGIGTTSPATRLSVNVSPANTSTNYQFKNISVMSGFGAGYGNNTIQSLLAAYDGSSIYAADIGYAYDGTGYALTLSTNDNTTGDPIERLRIASTGAATFSGNVTINKTSPQFQLYSSGADHNYSILGNSSTALEFWWGTFGSNTTKMLSLAASTGAATFSSSVTATGFFESSDIRLKDVIKEMTSFTGIDTIFYNWKDRRDHLDHIGYSAQQVEEILPYAVSESNGYKTVDYNQVHTFKIMLLEDRILKLEDELKQYKNGVQ